MKKTTISLLFPALLFIACQSGPGKEDIAASITKLQDELKTDSVPSPEKMIALQDALLLYADAFPKDSVSAKHLMKAGETASLLRQFDKALEIFGKIEKNYPNSKAAASAMFMKAYTLDNELKKFDEAKPAYEAFIQKYPNDEFADDAQFLLKNLGKSPEEIIKGFEQNPQ